jgi:hypothetical protein
MANRKLKMTEVETLAEGILLDFKELPGFKDAKVSVVHPIYDVGGNIGYYEVKFSSPDQENNGYAIISANTSDYPVVEFSEKGLTHHERFRHLTRGKDFRMVRFGPQYITAEDTKGELIAEIGLRPALIPKKLQTHMRNEKKVESGAVELGIPRVNLKTAGRRTQLQSYKIYKRNFLRPTLNVARIKEAWTHALKPRSNPGCQYNYFWSDGFHNHPYFLQISKNTPPNNNDHASGCGPTAWMNILGWHDLNWKTGILAGQRKYNDPYINALTMDLHDYLGTYEPWWTFGADQGFTWPDDMMNGDNFVRTNLYYDCSRWFRQDWWDTDEEWVFEVARSVARAKRPFIVGYYQDWHYAIGYGIAECRTHGWRQHSWIKIYPAWNTSDVDDKWIPKSTIFGVYGVYDFFPLLEFSYIENPQELEVVVSNAGGANRMFIYTGTAVFSSRGGVGANWLRGPISFEVGRTFTPTQFVKAVATAPLASISNLHHAVNAGWAIDRVEAYRDSNSGKTRIKMDYAIRDIDSYLHRVAYKLTVQAKL